MAKNALDRSNGDICLLKQRGAEVPMPGGSTWITSATITVTDDFASMLFAECRQGIRFFQVAIFDRFGPRQKIIHMFHIGHVNHTALDRNRPLSPGIGIIQRRFDFTGQLYFFGRLSAWPRNSS